MFGDKLIIGSKECSIDSKRRFFIPKSVCAEANDELVFCITQEDNLVVYNITSLNKTIESYESKIKDSENLEFIKAMKEEMEKVYASCLCSSKVDKQGRVIISQEVCEQFEIEDTIITQGLGNSMLLFSNKEKRDKYILRLRNK